MAKSAIKWSHPKKFKKYKFLGGYEYPKGGGKRKFVLKNETTGREIKFSGGPEQAKKDGWVPK